MPVSQEFIDAMAAVDVAVNEVAAVVTALRDTIKVSMTPAEVTTAKESLDAIAGRLKGIATDPNVPVPPPEAVFARLRKR